MNAMSKKQRETKPKHRIGSLEAKATERPTISLEPYKNIMATKRADKKRNIAKVVKAIINNPLQTQREIAKDINIGKSTVDRIQKEVGQIGAKDDRIVGICDKDLEIVVLGQKELARRLKENPKKMGTRDIVAAMETGTKRYTIFKGDITDASGGLKVLSELELGL